MLDAMILGWILTWFSLDDLIITGINEIFNTNYTIAVYWLLFFIIGLIICFTKKQEC